MENHIKGKCLRNHSKKCDTVFCFSRNFEERIETLQDNLREEITFTRPPQIEESRCGNSMETFRNSRKGEGSYRKSVVEEVNNKVIKEEVTLRECIDTTNSVPSTSLNNNMRYNSTHNLSKEPEKLGDMHTNPCKEII